MNMLFKLAWRNIWRNKRRSFITMASVLFAVMMACTSLSLINGINDQMVKNIVSFYTGYVQVHQKGYWDEQTLDNTFENSAKLQAELKANHHIIGMVPRLESFALASTETLTKGVMVIGTEASSEDKLTGLKKKLISGQYLQNDKPGVLVAEDLAKYLKVKVNDTVVLIGQGYHGSNAAGKYPVAGIVHFGSKDLNSRVIYLPLNEARILFDADNRLTSLALMIDKPNLAEKVAGDAGKKLGNDYEVMDWQTMLPELKQQLDGDIASKSLNRDLLYMIVGFGILGTVLMMMAERMHEFGILIAVGMKKWKLAFTVILETIFISLLGAFAGLVAVVPIMYYLNIHPIPVTGGLAKVYANFGMEPLIISSMDPFIFLKETLIVFCIALVISIYPLWGVMRLDAVKAMRT
jgi:ABC-type lipoprotein release transport system permease subunit